MSELVSFLQRTISGSKYLGHLFLKKVLLFSTFLGSADQQAALQFLQQAAQTNFVNFF